VNKSYNVSIVAGFLALATFGCQASQSGVPTINHKLVVNGNDHSVPVYSDEQNYLNTLRMKQQGGIEGAVGDVKQGLTAKQLDDQTSVEIVSSDDNGSVITVPEGPMKGLTGFVAKQNVD
jgi:hypothetical protein